MDDARQTRRTQRLGAYGIAIREAPHRGTDLLMTRISPFGFPVGYWALPGGGVDHGESPDEAVRREMFEETGLEVLDQRLVAVHSQHTVAPGRGDAWEDYHGVHLLYACRVDPQAVPHVVEVDGTTELATWLPVSDLSDGRPVLPVVEYVLERLDQLAAAWSSTT